MSLKLNIPEVSKKYWSSLLYFLLSLPKEERSDFYKHLNLISGYCQDVEISQTMSGMGGVKPIKDLLKKSSGFELATYKEFIRFHKEGYSSGDFHHIFLDAFLSVRIDMLLSIKGA